MATASVPIQPGKAAHSFPQARPLPSPLMDQVGKAPGKVFSLSLTVCCRDVVSASLQKATCTGHIHNQPQPGLCLPVPLLLPMFGLDEGRSGRAAHSSAQDSL